MGLIINSFIFLLILFISACSVNPVTGEKQLLLPSKSKDLQIGQEQYKPAQQSQGGPYLLDEKLTAYVTKVGMQGLGVALSDNDYRSLIIGGASLGAKLTMSKYGRDHELEADEYGM